MPLPLHKPSVSAPRGLAIAAERHAELWVMHAWDIPSGYEGLVATPEEREQVARDATEKLEAALLRVSADGPEVEHTITIHHMNPARALVELLGPAWYAVLGSNYGLASLEFLARYADPNAVIRLGQARLARFLIARSRGAWREDHAAGLVAAAKETLALWGPEGMDFAELAEDIAHEAEQALFLTRQIKQIDERVANLYADADPEGIVASAPGVGPVISAVIAGRIGDPHRFTSLAAIRAYIGLVPKVSQCGVSKVESSITKAGDPLLREMLCTAADQARKVDPQIAAKYQRLMAGDRHHDSAICHLATLMVTRIATCMRNGQPYALRDIDGTPITEAKGRAIVKERYQIDPRRRDNVRHKRMRDRRKQAADRESQESQGAPTSQSADTKPTSRQVA